MFAASLGHWLLEVYIIICTVCTSCWRTQQGRFCLLYTGKGVGETNVTMRAAALFSDVSVSLEFLNMNHILKCVPEPKAQ
jgi:hypothetical protein